MEEIKYSESEEPKAKKQESALPKRDNGGFIVYISKGRTEVLPFAYPLKEMPACVILPYRCEPLISFVHRNIPNG